MKNAVQMGSTISHTPAADRASGAATLIGVRVGVAVSAVPANTPGLFAVEGVYTLPKLAADNVAQGALLYWDAVNSRLTTTTAGNTQAGYAFEAAGAGVAVVDIKINA